MQCIECIKYFARTQFIFYVFAAQIKFGEYLNNSVVLKKCKNKFWINITNISNEILNTVCVALDTKWMNVWSKVIQIDVSLCQPIKSFLLWSHVWAVECHEYCTWQWCWTFEICKRRHSSYSNNSHSSSLNCQSTSCVIAYQTHSTLICFNLATSKCQNRRSSGELWVSVHLNFGPLFAQNWKPF